jgi:hypothetical protein
MLNHCPGAGALRGNVTISEKICPECGREIELFSCEPYGVCECGFVAYNDTQSCVQWCAHARECVGEELYEHMKANDVDRLTKQGK